MSGDSYLNKGNKMELRPEERGRIDEEEKDKLEPQGELKTGRKGYLGCLGVIVVIFLIVLFGNILDSRKNSRKTTKTDTQDRPQTITDEDVREYFTHLKDTYGDLIRYYDNRPFSIVIHVPAIGSREARVLVQGEAREFYRITGKAIVIRVVDPNNKEYRGVYLP